MSRDGVFSCVASSWCNVSHANTKRCSNPANKHQNIFERNIVVHAVMKLFRICGEAFIAASLASLDIDPSDAEWSADAIPCLLNDNKYCNRIELLWAVQTGWIRWLDSLRLSIVVWAPIFMNIGKSSRNGLLCSQKRSVNGVFTYETLEASQSLHCP